MMNKGELLFISTKNFERYRKKIVALAILTDDKKNFKPNQYQYHFYETTLSYTYQIFKVLDQDEKKLEESDTPFALVVLAVLYLIKDKKGDPNNKYQFKLKLPRLLYEKGYNKNKIRNIFLFIDAILVLPDSYISKYIEELNQLSGGKEHMGMKGIISDFGREQYYQGRNEEKLKMIEKGLDLEIISEITGLTSEEIQNLLRQKGE